MEIENNGTTALQSLVDALNAVIANGAETFGFLTAQPDFRGHELCTAQSFVQGLDDGAVRSFDGHLADAELAQPTGHGK